MISTDRYKIDTRNAHMGEFVTMAAEHYESILESRYWARTMYFHVNGVRWLVTVKVIYKRRK